MRLGTPWTAVDARFLYGLCLPTALRLFALLTVCFLLACCVSCRANRVPLRRPEQMLDVKTSSTLGTMTRSTQYGTSQDVAALAAYVPADRVPLLVPAMAPPGTPECPQRACEARSEDSGALLLKCHGPEAWTAEWAQPPDTSMWKRTDITAMGPRPTYSNDFLYSIHGDDADDTGHADDDFPDGLVVERSFWKRHQFTLRGNLSIEISEDGQGIIYSGLRFKVDSTAESTNCWIAPFRAAQAPHVVCTPRSVIFLRVPHMVSFEALLGVRIGEASHPGPVPDAIFLQAVSDFGGGAVTMDGGDDFASVFSGQDVDGLGTPPAGRATPDPFEGDELLLCAAVLGVRTFPPDVCEPECSGLEPGEHHPNCTLFNPSTRQPVDVSHRIIPQQSEQRRPSSPQPQPLQCSRETAGELAGLHNATVYVPEAHCAEARMHRDAAPYGAAGVPSEVQVEHNDCPSNDAQLEDTRARDLHHNGACEIPVPTDPTALAGALSIILLARAAADAGDEEEASRLVRGHQWSGVYCPLLWGAASGLQDCSMVDWLTQAARHCFIPFAGEEERPGPAIVGDAWAAVQAAVRREGIASKNGLCEWYRTMYGAALRPDAHLRREAQHYLVDQSVELAGGRPLLETLLATLTLHIAAQPELPQQLESECRAAQEQVQPVGPRRGRGTARARHRSPLFLPPLEVPETSHILEFDGASQQNPGPAGAGALIRAPARDGGNVVWACSAPLGPETNNVAEYSGGTLGIQAAARITGNPVAALHCRGDSMLVISQIQGRWQVNEPRLIPLLASLRAAVEALNCPVTLEYRPRAENWRADALAAAAADRSRQGDATVQEWWGANAAARIDEIRISGAPPDRRHRIQAVPLGGAVAATTAAVVQATDNANGADPQQGGAAGQYGADADLQIPPRPSPATGANDWSALDHVSTLDCFVSPFRQLAEVPAAFVEAWAAANTEVHELYYVAEGDASKNRALKWILALHHLLLREPVRGGRRGLNELPRRFKAWAEGDLAYVVRSWEADKARAARTRRATTAANHSVALDKILFLIGKGELGRAQRLLESRGLGNLSDARIISQLADKHPSRKEELPSIGDDVIARLTPLEVTLDVEYQHLPRLSAPGPSGYRNEYLMVLSRLFTDERARGAVGLHDRFGADFVNGRLPPWFTYLWLTVRLVAPVKRERPGAVSDVRPVGIGEPRRVTCASSVLRARKDRLAEKLWPQQVAIGIKSGIHVLAFGLRAGLECNPGWILLKLDFINAFNEIKRAAVLRAVAEDFDREFEDLLPLFRTQLGPKAMILLSGESQGRADFDSEEGMQQGSAEGPAGFCLGIHRDLVAADEELAAHGGCAKADMDDCYLLGPIEQVLPTALRFADRLHHRAGIQLNLGKSAVHSTMPARDQAFINSESSFAAAFKVGCLDGIDPTVDAYGAGFGIAVGGVPVGDETFVRGFVDGKVDEASEHIQKTTDKLRGIHCQSLWAQVSFCLRPKIDHLAQTCYGSAGVAVAFQRFDDSIRSATEASVQQTLSDIDAPTTRRLALPARLFGCGLRRVSETAAASFAGSVCRVAPALIDSNVRGELRRGFMHEQLAPMLGANSFDEGMEAARFAHLIAGTSTLGVQLNRCWESLVGMVSEARGARPEDGALAHPAISAGYDGSGVLRQPQRAFTAEVELAQYDALDEVFKALPPHNMRRATWLNLDRFSTQWVSAMPSPKLGLVLGNAAFAEVFASYLALASPASAPLVGQRIAGNRDALDVHGIKLTTLALPGDGWRTRHDTIKHTLHRDILGHGGTGTCEVFGLFSALLPQPGQDAVGRLSMRKRQALVPDFLLRTPEGQDTLYEVKVISAGPTRYALGSVSRGEATARRAAHLTTEYRDKARRVDQQYVGTAAGEDGPVSRRLAGYGRVRGLVFGAFGEASEDVHDLVQTLASSYSARHWIDMHARDPNEAKAIVARMLYRSWGLAAVRANATLKLGGISFVGAGSAAAAGRRNASTAWHARAREAYQLHHAGWRLH